MYEVPVHKLEINSVLRTSTLNNLKKKKKARQGCIDSYSKEYS